MSALAESRASVRGAASHRCPVKQTHVDVSFCDHVCSYRDACTVHATRSARPAHDGDPVIPLTTAALSQLTRLGVNPLQHKGHNLNGIHERYLHDPQRTKHQVDVLRAIPWINHHTGSAWPTCDCLACCGALIISVVENASTRTQ